MVEGGMKCIKFLLFAFNFIFFITGIILIVVGALVQTEFTEYENFTTSKYTSTPVFLIVVGVIIFIIAFFGCCGAVKESFCMTMTFAVLLGLIFILEISAGIAGYVLKDDLRQEVSDGMNAQLKEYNKTEGVTKAWDQIQHDMQCCGVTNSTDWESAGFKKGQYPDSCCKKQIKGCGSAAKPVIFENGCLTELEDFFKSNALTLGGVGIGIAFVQIIGVVFACCLARAIKKEYEVV